MLNKLLAIIVVLLIAVVMAIPAFAQTADLRMEFGSNDWLINQFGDESGDVTAFCETAGQSPETQRGWTAVFPNLPGLCGWSV